MPLALAVAAPAGDRKILRSDVIRNRQTLATPQAGIGRVVVLVPSDLSPQTNYHVYPTFFPLRYPETLILRLFQCYCTPNHQPCSQGSCLSRPSSTLTPRLHQDPSGPCPNLEPALLSVSGHLRYRPPQAGRGVCSKNMYSPS